MDTKQDQETGQTIDVKVTPVEPVEAPAEETVAQDLSSVPPTAEIADNISENNPGNGAEPQGEVPVPDAAPAATQHSHKSGAPIVAIVAAIFVAIALAAITVYAYMQQQVSSTEKTSESTQTTTPSVSEDDVNQAEKDVDGALQSADEADFVESELTDQSLGL